MPLPKPHPGEAQDAFIGRCLRDPATKEMDTGDASEEVAHQMRVAACFRTFHEAKAAEEQLETKVLGAEAALEIKSEERGEVEAVIARLGVVDRDGDFTLASAFKDGQKVKLSGWGHDSALPPHLNPSAPVGKGTISVSGDRVLFKGRYFLSTERGREAFQMVKEFGPDMEWSYGYKVGKTGDLTPELKKLGARRVIAETTVFEASPVFRGAGIGTGTLTVKSDEKPPEPTPEELEAKAKAEAETKAAAEAAEAAVREKDALAAQNRESLERFERTRKALGW